MVKAAIFDLDGTLLNRDESVKMFIHSQYNKFKKILGHIPKEIYITRFLELDNHGYVWKDKVYQQLVDEYKITEISWEELLYDYICTFKHHCVSFPNLISMLEDLKRMDLKFGMITNGKGQFQLGNIKALGIEKYFDTILISEWEGIKKPDPQIFKKALAQLNVSPKESIFVGDHPENDVKASRNVGMIGIWKKNCSEGNIEADFTIHDLGELPVIIKALNAER
ncbi:HAD family hydrolase [Bacillus sp. APMAM]|uniref:HAD family hydrolase n=1 Tax=Margalitia sp. FSL K6-0131 TaxID=2954604 RepID=UPI000F89A4E1|nr:HAD family hydrolase [Bacillus sp. APMAM]RTZ53608.1 HAD family hydrolase [Bacillus sp. SAJ1]